MLTATLEKPHGFQLFDDYLKLDASQWTDINDGAAPAASLVSSRGGVLSLATAGVLDSHHGFVSSSAPFVVEPGKGVKFECKLKLTEAAVNRSAIWIGFSDVYAGGFLTASTSLYPFEPPSPFSGFAFFKVAGTSAWSFVLSNGTTQKIMPSVGPFLSGADQTLEINIEANNTANGLLFALPTLGVNGVYPQFQGQVQQTFELPLAGLAPLRVVFGVRAGSASAETLLVDYVGCEQPR